MQNHYVYLMVFLYIHTYIYVGEIDMDIFDLKYYIFDIDMDIG